MGPRKKCQTRKRVIAARGLNRGYTGIFPWGVVKGDQTRRAGKAGVYHARPAWHASPWLAAARHALPPDAASRLIEPWWSDSGICIPSQWSLQMLESKDHWQTHVLVEFRI
jgi:hypothetical protein